MVIDIVPLDIRHEFIGEGAPVEVREVSLLLCTVTIVHPLLHIQITVKLPNNPMCKGAFSRAIFLWQRSIVTETLAKYLRSQTARKS